MSFIIIVIYAFVLAIIAFAFINFEISIALYIAYLILVPYLQLDFGGLSLSYNLINSFLLTIFIFKVGAQKKYGLDFRAVKPFLFLFCSLLILAFFASDTPLDFELNYWRVSFMRTCIISFIVWNVIITSPKMLGYVKWALIIAFAIAGIYSIYLMQLGGANPYTSYLTKYFGVGTDFADLYASSDMQSRLSFSSAAKIQSTMIHPMTWALNLTFMIMVLITHFIKEKKKWYLSFVIFLAFNLLISGVRTGIAALMLSLVYFLLRVRSIKVIILGAVLGILCFLLILSNNDLSNLFASFTNFSEANNKLGGSSISMRMHQLNGAFSEIKNTEFVGKGYDWTHYYYLTKGDHPILLNFESLIYVVLCNSGYIGIFIWIFFFFIIFLLQRQILQSKSAILLMDAFVISYITYAIGTGEYDYLQFFAIFYSFLLGYLSIVKINVNL